MKKLPWWQPEVGAPETERVLQVLASNYINEGQVTEEFARRLAEMLGVRFAVPVTSGTAALFLSLAALGVGPGDEVIVPDVTFVATASAVRLAGATVVLADVDEATLTLSPRSFEAAISPRTRVVIPVHVSGRAAAMGEILAIAARHRIHVVEDAAEAFLSKHEGRFLGTLGQQGCFSFSPNKTITTGQGGAIVTDDERIFARLRELKDQGRRAPGTGGDDLHPSVGFNFKLTNLQAAVGLAQLERLEARLARQRAIHQAYVSALGPLEGIRILPFAIQQGETPQWTDAVIDSGPRRDALDRFLTERGMGCRRFWFPLHTQEPYRRPDEELPVSTRMCARALWLPSAFTLSERDIEDVVAAIREFFDGR